MIIRPRPRGCICHLTTTVVLDRFHQLPLTSAAYLVRVHFVDSRGGRLPAMQVLASARENPAALSAFLYGPAGMVHNFESEFRRAGVPSRHIYGEYFDWR